MDAIKKRIEFIEALIQKAPQRLQTVSAFKLIAEYKRWVFLQGKATDGSKIGKYDTEQPMTINLSRLSGQLPRTKLKAKATQKGNVYYAKGEGYNAFRPDVERDNSFVNLDLSGATKDSIKVGTSGDDVVVGFTNELRKLILEGQETRFKKKIIEPADEVKKAAIDEARAEFEFLATQGNINDL